MTAQDNGLAVRVGAISERGHRSENQDQMSGFSSALGYVYLVADGMGGHQGGAQAAQMVSEGFRHYVMNAQPGTRLEDALRHAAASINDELLRRGQTGDPSMRHMGSTVVLVALRQSPHGREFGYEFGYEFIVGHIGDSRAYLLRDGRLRQLTGDHSMVQRMVEEGILTAEAARNHPNANILTRAFGQQQDVMLDLSAPEPLQPGDVLMVCSDGLWGYVPDEEIAVELARTAQMETVAANLVQLALNRGSDDNITVQAVRVEGSGGTVAVAPPARLAGMRSTLVENNASPATAPALAVNPTSPSRQRTLWIVACTAVLTAGTCAGTYFVARKHTAHADAKAAHISDPLKQPHTAGAGPKPVAGPPATITPSVPPTTQPAGNPPPPTYPPVVPDGSAPAHPPANAEHPAATDHPATPKPAASEHGRNMVHAAATDTKDRLKPGMKKPGKPADPKKTEKGKTAKGAKNPDEQPAAPISRQPPSPASPAAAGTSTATPAQAAPSQAAIERGAAKIGSVVGAGEQKVKQRFPMNNSHQPPEGAESGTPQQPQP